MDARIERSSQMGYVLVAAVDRQRILNQIIGADGEERTLCRK